MGTSISSSTSFTQHARRIIREELSGWKRWEIVWLGFCIAVILALSLYWGDTLMGIVSATTGVAYTVCNGKGKRMAYLFGMVNSLLYAIISFGAHYYGEMMLNGFYYFPMMFWGLYVWNKNMDRSTFEVGKRRMSWRQRGLLFTVLAAGTAAYGTVLWALGDALPFTDAFTTFVSVVAMVLAVKRFAEQWPLWIAVDAVTIVMWAVAFANGADTIATLAMWVIYLANGIIMWVKWARETRETRETRKAWEAREARETEAHTA